MKEFLLHCPSLLERMEDRQFPFKKSFAPILTPCSSEGWIRDTSDQKFFHMSYICIVIVDPKTSSSD